MHSGLRRSVLSICFALLGALTLPRSAGAACPGDCDSSGGVTVDDLVIAINVALGRAPLNACDNTDMDSSASLDIQEIVNAVMSSVNGCDDCDAANGELTSTFEAIQKQIFEPRGCTAAVCHGNSPGQGGLDLSPEVAYDNLFEVPSTGANLNRVTPGSRERSFLYLKLAAATDPSQLPTGYNLPGSPMPSALPPLTPDELEAIRLWIYNGAPETGTVIGTEGLLNACLPPPRPISITPLEPPAPGEGVQFVVPPWDLPGTSEFEGCFATYYDFSAQVPEEFQSGDGNRFVWKGFEVRQDPQSHHLLMYYSPLNLEPGGIDVNHPQFGTWTCRGGELNGQECDPKDLQSCGEEGVCASEFRSSFACVGYGQPDPQGRPPEIIGGAPQAQTNFLFADGVYQQLGIKGVIYWNPHAFNLTPEDHVMNGRVNFYFAEKRENQAVRISDFSAIFRPNNPPFTKETFCNKHVFPIGSRVFLLFAHTHKHGEYYWATDPNGELIYENYSYSDPVMERYDPPLEFDSMVEEERTVEYCAIFNNGVAPDGSPDIDLVTRSSRVPPGTPIGHCTPVACVAGKVGEACTTDADCDSSEGAGDGWCDACRITGGESTENEMFVLFGAQYIDPTVPGAELDLLPFPED